MTCNTSHVGRCWIAGCCLGFPADGLKAALTGAKLPYTVEELDALARHCTGQEAHALGRITAGWCADSRVWTWAIGLKWSFPYTDAGRGFIEIARSRQALDARRFARIQGSVFLAPEGAETR
jgi:hypothetical protein